MRLKKAVALLLTCTLLITLCVNSSAAETYNAWTTLAQKPNTGFGAKSFLYNDYVYNFGSGSSSTYKKIDRYQISTDTWSTLTDAPIENTGAAAAQIGSKVYIFGLGAQTTASQRISAKSYDMASGTWTNLANCPSYLHNGGAAEIDGNIYLLCGTKANFYVYSPSSNSYTELAAPPVTSYNQAMTAYGREIFVFGAGSSNNGTIKYNVDAKVWTTLPVSPFEVRCSSTVSYENKAYLLFSGTSASPFYSYNFTTGEWITLQSNSYNGFRGSAVESSGTLYFIGGDGNGTKQARKYSPAPIVTVGFNTDGGLPITIASRSIEVGKTYGSLPIVTKDGFRFDGWFTHPVGGTKILDTTIITNANSHTLYAQWTKNAVNVSFNSNGGSLPSPAIKEVTVGDKYGTLPAVTKQGYTLLGWFLEEN